jgi:IclR family transcriptional regulator, acetate operon repressor
METMPGEREPAARAIDVLIWLADHTADTWGVRQVAREMNTSPSTIYRIFQIFESRDLVTKNEDGRYTPGLELFRICQVFSQRLSPVKIAKPHLEKLALACGETVLLAAYGARRGQMIVIDIIDAPHPLRWVVRLNQWNAIYAGATGLAILAYLPEEERQAIYEKDLERFTERTLVTPEDIEAELASVRARGYAYSRGQRSRGAVGFGVPLYDAAGDVFGDVCITVPEGRFDPAQEPRLGRLLITAAADISADFRNAGFLRDP